MYTSAVMYPVNNNMWNSIIVKCKTWSEKDYITALICTCVIFLFADQNLMAPNLSAIADDFGFNNEEKDEKLGGNIAFGFFVLGAPAALIVGYLADTVNRCRLLGCVVLFGESACLATYWVQTYKGLFICRVLTGISIGGATPIIFSLLADYYPEELRVYVSTLVGISISFGIAGGQMLAGIVGPTAGWRLPFLLVAVPAIFLGILIGLTGKEPRRGSQERSLRIVSSVVLHSQDITTSCHYYQTNPLHVDHYQTTPSTVPSGYPSSQEILASPGRNSSQRLSDSRNTTSDEHSALNTNHQAPVAYSEKIDCRKVAVIFRTPSAILVFLQGIPGCIPWGVIYVFLNDYFSSNRGLSVQQATMGIFSFGVGGLIGQLFGGWLGQILYVRDKRLQIVLMSLSTILSVIPMMYLLNAGIAADIGFYSMAGFAGALVSINGPNVRAVLQNVCTPEVRGTAFAVFTLTDDIGKGAGPVIIVQMLKACNGDRRRTYNIAISLWILCGVLLLLLVFTVIEDEDRVQRTILDSIQGKRYRSELNQQEQQPTSATTSPSTITNPLIRNADFLALDTDSHSETSSMDLASLGTPSSVHSISPKGQTWTFHRTNDCCDTSSPVDNGLNHGSHLV